MDCKFGHLNSDRDLHGSTFSHYSLTSETSILDLYPTLKYVEQDAGGRDESAEIHLGPDWDWDDGRPPETPLQPTEGLRKRNTNESEQSRFFCKKSGYKSLTNDGSGSQFVRISGKKSVQVVYHKHPPPQLECASDISDDDGLEEINLLDDNVTTNECSKL